jgi:DNA-binding beta-propeller fold protein YncE
MKLGTTTLSVTTAGRPRQKAATSAAASSGGGGNGYGNAPAVYNEITTATYVRQNRLSMYASHNPNGIAFKPDGTKLFISSAMANYYLEEYSLSTPWDISTSTLNHRFTPPSGHPRPMGIFLKPDGTKLFYIDFATDDVVGFDLSTAWDLSTISSNYTSIFGFSGESYARGLWFKSDGTKMFAHGFSSDKLRGWDLTTPWDITSATNATISSGSVGSIPLGLFFKDDGTKVYVTDNSGDKIRTWTMTTPFDITGITGSNASNTRNVSTFDSTPTGIFISQDGTHMYLGGSGNDTLYQFDL